MKEPIRYEGFETGYKKGQEDMRAEMEESIIGCIDSEIGCIKGGNALTGGEQEIAIEVAKNIKARILNDIPSNQHNKQQVI